METDWPERSLGELFKVKHGFAFKGTHFSEDESEYQVVTPGNFAIGGGFQDGKAKFYDGPIPDGYVLSPGDIIVTMTDLSKESDTLGNAAIVPDDSKIWLHNQRIGLLEFKNPDETNPLFISYMLRARAYRWWIVASATGTTVRHTSPGRIQVFKSRLPPIGEQKSIAHILGSLDAKIELNRKMNQTLESMAQALFKSWFVDFDPVFDNALAAGKPIPDALAERAETRRKALADGTANREMAKLFPDSFEYNEERGWIPEGWEVVKAESIVTRRKVEQKFTQANVSAVGAIPVFDQSTSLILGFHNGSPDIAATIANPGFIFGDHTCITHLSTIPFSVGPNVIPLMASRCDPYWTYSAIKGLQTFQEYRRHWMEFKVKNVVVPTDALTSTFGGIVRDMFVSMDFNRSVSPTLGSLRDTLLPKLISGELRIPEAEKLVEDALA